MVYVSAHLLNVEVTAAEVRKGERSLQCVHLLNPHRQVCRHLRLPRSVNARCLTYLIHPVAIERNVFHHGVFHALSLAEEAADLLLFRGNHVWRDLRLPRSARARCLTYLMHPVAVGHKTSHQDIIDKAPPREKAAYLLLFRGLRVCVLENRLILGLKVD